MINVQSLSRNYGTTIAVNEVSFSIAKGEVIGLLGHNGAGKSTIMRMLSGYLEPSSGSIQVGGRELSDNLHSVQASLGYLPEQLPLYPEMRVADYLNYSATLKRIPAAGRNAMVGAALNATDLLDRALDPIAILSRGQRQRVGVAQAILGRPSLLILDEPTNGLDPQQTVQMRDLIGRLSREATIILSTHILQEVDASCDRVLVMSQGALVLDQPLKALRSSRSLQVCTDIAVKGLDRLLRRMPQVKQLELTKTEDSRQHFVLHLHDNADRDTAANNVARCVVEAGARLYHLYSATRDLDSVFREVSSNGH